MGSLDISIIKEVLESWVGNESVREDSQEDKVYSLLLDVLPYEGREDASLSVSNSMGLVLNVQDIAN